MIPNSHFPISASHIYPMVQFWGPPPPPQSPPLIPSDVGQETAGALGGRKACTPKPPPLPQHPALSTVLTTTRVKGLKAVSQPGLQVTHSAGEVGRAVVPPTRVPQSGLSLPGPLCQRPTLRTEWGDWRTGGGGGGGRKRQGDGLEPGLLSVPLKPLAKLS